MCISVGTPTLWTNRLRANEASALDSMGYAFVNEALFVNSWKQLFPRRELHLEKKVSLEDRPRYPSNYRYLLWCILVLTLLGILPMMSRLDNCVMDVIVRSATLIHIPQSLERCSGEHLPSFLTGAPNIINFMFVHEAS